MSDRLYFSVPDECDNMLAQRFLRDKCGLSARIITRLKREKDGILMDGKILRTIDCVQSEINRDSICIPVVCGIVGFVIMMITESHVSTIAYWGFFVMFEQLLNYEKNLGSSEGAVHY